MEISIDNMRPEDHEAVCSIYMEGVKAGDLVLDTDDPAGMDLASGRNLVARAKDRVIGWSVVEPAGKEGVANVSVFVKPACRGMGVGKALLDTTVSLSARSGISALLAGIVPQNVPALMLHKSCGFHAVGMLKRAGATAGKVRNAVLLQRNCG
ncbi:MAG: Acetyltransferase (GNAT) family protein [Methanocella sp. PtaU1.Bin125]|nr:MAG: Acetyltransferase (GNAT) family protein [Methanocella sp. PtaU1.Bin125]